MIVDGLLEWLERAFAGASSPADAAPFLADTVVVRPGVEQVLTLMRDYAGSRPAVEVRRERKVPFLVQADFGPETLDCYLDDDGRFVGFTAALPDVDVAVVRSDELDASLRDELVGLFCIAYDEADESYLDTSLRTLGWVATAHATDDGGARRLVGFSLGDTRTLDLPVVGPSPVLLAGLGCVDPGRRRQGLFSHLSNLSLRAGGSPPDRRLGAGRVAHPATMRSFALAPTVVPKPGVRPNELQRAVGQAVADAYGVATFDPDTFVCRGRGRPIGYPRMTQEVEPHEWEVFAPVDRSQGDSLLALMWQGDAPEGW